jgi:hypothetical protein
MGDVAADMALIEARNLVVVARYEWRGDRGFQGPLWLALQAGRGGEVDTAAVSVTAIGGRTEQDTSVMKLRWRLTSPQQARRRLGKASPRRP